MSTYGPMPVDTNMDILDEEAVEMAAHYNRTKVWQCLQRAFREGHTLARAYGAAERMVAMRKLFLEEVRQLASDINLVLSQVLVLPFETILSSLKFSPQKKSCQSPFSKTMTQQSYCKEFGQNW